MVGLVYHNVNDENVLLTFISNLAIFDIYVAEVDLITHSYLQAKRYGIYDRSKLKIKEHNFKAKKTNKVRG